MIFFYFDFYNKFFYFFYIAYNYFTNKYIFRLNLLNIKTFYYKFYIFISINLILHNF